MSELVLNDKKSSPKKVKFTHQTRETITGLLFIAPWIIGFLVFGLYPICYSLFLSFQKVSFPATGIEIEWHGLRNYIYAFTGMMESSSEQTASVLLPLFPSPSHPSSGRHRIQLTSLSISRIIFFQALPQRRFL